MPEVVIASWNVHSGVDGWGRPFDVVAGCRSLDADVLVLQETWSSARQGSLAQRVGEALGYRVEESPIGRATMFSPPTEPGRRWGPSPWTGTRYGPRVDSPTPRRARSPGGQISREQVVPAGPVSGRGGPRRMRGEHAVAIERGTVGLAVLSRLPITQMQRWDLGERWGDPTSRCAVAVEVAQGRARTEGGGGFVVVGTHLSHVRHGSPMQVATLRRRLAATAPSWPAVLAGDLNLPGPAVCRAFGGFRRVVRGATWPAWRPMLQPDHVLVNESATGIGEIVPILGSDHLPVRARVSWT